MPDGSKRAILAYRSLMFACDADVVGACASTPWQDVSAGVNGPLMVKLLDEAGHCDRTCPALFRFGEDSANAVRRRLALYLLPC